MSSRDSVQALIDNGYYIIPITKGQKRPAVSGWQNWRATSADEIMPYIDKGCGIGILTGVGDNPLCGVDIDSMDEGLVDSFMEWCWSAYSPRGMRVGNPPKKLFLFRTDKAYTKVSSRDFLDANGKVHKLELLGAGQQFVSFGTHPDTGKNYKWIPSSESPINTSIRNLGLPLYEADLKAMILAFEERALAAGLTPKTSSRRSNDQTADASATDILMNYEAATGLTADECRKTIEGLDCEDYDTWLKVGMALHHEFSGESDGLVIWNEWSQEGTNYKDIGDLTFRWNGFVATPGRTPVTMRSVVHEAKEVHKEEIRTEKRSTGGQMYDMVNSCGDTYALLEDVAPKLGAMAGVDMVLKMESEKHLRERFKRLEGIALPVATARKALAKGKKTGSDGEVAGIERPAWAEGWVYVSEANNFINVNTGVTVDLAGFRGLFDAEMGDADEGTNAAAWALNNKVLPKADRRMYMPGTSNLFKMDGVRYVNSYSHKGRVELSGDPAADDKDDYRAGVFKRHLELLIAGGKWTREVHLFANFLRYCAENPGKHMTWAVLLQGGYGDGKSEPITRLMGRLVGRNNTRVIQAQTIEGDKFNGWAEGHVFGIIEEIKLHGHNRYDILNKLKPIITNDVIEIRRMRTDSYVAPNTGKYYITTNYKDALPVVSADRRYMILFSQFPAERRNDTDYFSELFRVIDSDEGSRAIGRWLLGVPYHEDFKPQGHAPHTIDKEHTVELSQDSFLDKIEAALTGSDSPMFGEDYVVYGPFYEYIDLMHMANGKGFLSDRVLGKYLTELGYNYIGRKRLSCGQHRIWMKGDSGDLGVFMDKYETQKLLT